MKLQNLSVALIVLAGLLGVLYWSNHHKPTEDSEVKASADAAPKILSLNEADITGLRIERKDQPAVDLSRSASGVWQITAPQALAADQDSVSTLLSTLSALNSQRLLEEKASDVAGYGLANPPLEVDVTLRDNKTQKLLVGEQTAVGDAYYVMLAGDPRLFTIAGYSKTSLDKSLNDLRDRRLLTADFDKVSQIELINLNPKSKQDITLAREKDAWQILKPQPYRADPSPVQDLIRNLQDAKLEPPAETQAAKPLDAAFRAATPVATVKISGASGPQEFEVRKDKSDYYAKSSVVSGIYKVPPSLASNLDKTLDNFRNKKIFDFSYEDPNKVEVHDGSKSYFLTRSGTDWWGPDGKKLDESTVEGLVSKLRDLSADKFPDTVFTAPTIQITVTSRDGKLVEKVSLAKNGESYVAKRENEPELYQVSATSVNDLEKAATDLKPAAAAPAKK